MKKIMLASFVLFCAAVFQSCHKITGTGPVVSQAYSLTGFTSVSSGIDGDVYYTQDSFYKVEIQAQQNILNIIETPIVNGELQLKFEKYKNVTRHDRIVVYITAPSLNGLGINGSGNIRAGQPISGNHLSLKVNGSGSVNIASFTGESITGNISGSGSMTVSGGTVTNEALRISGSGDMDLLGVYAKTASIEVSGSGNASVRVSDNLDVRISGSGNVYYMGNPSVHSVISGSGSIAHM